MAQNRTGRLSPLPQHRVPSGWRAWSQPCRRGLRPPRGPMGLRLNSRAARAQPDSYNRVPQPIVYRPPRLFRESGPQRRTSSNWRRKVPGVDGRVRVSCAVSRDCRCGATMKANAGQTGFLLRATPCRPPSPEWTRSSRSTRAGRASTLGLCASWPSRHCRRPRLWTAGSTLSGRSTSVCPAAR